jgi:hypothetical protein
MAIQKAIPGRYPRGIRDTAPAGVLLGRNSGGPGRVEYITTASLAAALISTGLVSSTSSVAAPLLALVNGDNPVGFILDPSGQTIGVPQ